MDRGCYEFKTSEEVNEKIKQLEEQLKELEEKQVALRIKNDDRQDTNYDKRDALAHIRVNMAEGGEILKEKMKVKIEINRLKKYLEELPSKQYKEKVVLRAKEIARAENLSPFSWGINLTDSEDILNVILSGTTNSGEPITVQNCGELRGCYENNLTIQEFQKINQMELNLPSSITDMSTGITHINAKLIKEAYAEAIKKMPQVFSKLNLLMISKGIGKDRRNYFILSKINEEQLKNEELRDYFINTYCSDLYLNTIEEETIAKDSDSKQKGGIYAGDILKSENGGYRIDFDDKAMELAIRAELQDGSSKMNEKNPITGKKIEMPIVMEPLRKMILHLYNREFIVEPILEELANKNIEQK